MKSPRKRHYTFFIVPEKTARIHSFTLPTKVIQGIAGLMSFGFVLFLYFMVDYVDSKGKMKELRALREEVREQGVQIQAFAGELSGIEAQMGKLRQFDTKLRIITNLEPPKQTENILGTGGYSAEVGEYGAYVGVDHELILRKMHSDLNNMKATAGIQEKSFEELMEFLKDQKSLLVSTPSIWPTRGWITSGFGYRPYPFTGNEKMHEGIDIATRMGTPVVAPADGVVTFVGSEGSFGNLIVIDHGYGISTRFGHLSEIYIRVGKRVRRGDKIAAVGDTGRCTGPHVHYEVRLNGVPVNPANYILD